MAITACLAPTVQLDGMTSLYAPILVSSSAVKVPIVEYTIPPSLSSSLIPLFMLSRKRRMDLRWAYYCLLTYDINNMDSGSAIPSTSREDFYRLPVEVPPVVEQQAIACILGALDDKIELNRRMNQTLEAMARAIFKSWFVDFNPVPRQGRSPAAPRPRPQYCRPVP